ncbi:hypothetical protein OEZ85_005067 [Tetradesmus obliquus]|uniref:Uncharacterized protein n=1 Tax=Tetradesmus obliquus TaxID=3088 RepID=A0ABY8UGU0_TETOB|nr:hypothetical protein OEZ85_005067 [Tetradesmus obliquus]
MGNWRCIRHRQLEDGSWQQQALQPTEELLKFLSTAPGATWLADVLLEFPGNVDKLRHASLTEVNQFVIAKYKEFTASDIGTRLIFGSTQRSAVQADTLMLPVYIVEDFVRQRLRAKITRNWWSIGWFLAIRTPITCAAVHCAKHLVRKHLLAPHRGGRCKRVVAAATFVLDELLPTQFYGPLLCYALLAHKMVGELDDS